MHLTELYSRDLGCKAGTPYLTPHFFPIPKGEYVTIHNSDKVPAKSYSYWPTVVKIVKPELEKRNIKLYQVGAKGDLPIDGVDHFFDYLTFKQSAYLLSQTLCHFGIDSVPGHIASVFDKPTVTLIAHTYAQTCKPLWNGDKALILESHRNGNKPSFSLNEDPKTIDLIKPEEIAQALFKQIGITQAKSQETMFIGSKFLYKTIDLIPIKESPVIGEKNAEVRVRMDVAFNENELLNILQRNNIAHTIVTNRPINESLINGYKPKINKIIYTAPEFDARFLKFLRHSALTFELNCDDQTKLASQRKKFFHFDIVYQNKLEEATKIQAELKEKIHGDVRIDPAKIYVLGNQHLISLGKSVEDVNFWVDFEYFRAYVETEYTH